MRAKRPGPSGSQTLRCFPWLSHRSPEKRRPVQLGILTEPPSELRHPRRSLRSNKNALAGQILRVSIHRHLEGESLALSAPPAPRHSAAAAPGSTSFPRAAAACSELRRLKKGTRRDCPEMS